MSDFTPGPWGVKKLSGLFLQFMAEGGMADFVDFIDENTD